MGGAGYRFSPLMSYDDPSGILVSLVELCIVPCTEYRNFLSGYPGILFQDTGTLC